MVLFEIACDDYDCDDFESEVAVQKFAVMEPHPLTHLNSTGEDLRRSSIGSSGSQDAGPYEVKVLQLLPDFDGCFDEGSGGAISLDDVISYTSDELNDLEKEVNFDDADEEFAGELLGNPSLLPALGISPAVVQRIRSDSLNASDWRRKRQQEDDEENGDLAPDFFPTLLGRLSPRLSLSFDGFIMLKDYKISPDTLGGGKLSEVRLAYSQKDGTQYAVKIHSKMKLQKHNLLLRTSRNPLEEVYREIEILQKLDHPNIIKLIDVVDEEDEDNLYMVFERLDRELMTLPSDTPFTEDDARRSFKDILAGVESMHNNGIVHRDLKPENMLVCREGRIKIADFGFCDHMVPNPATKEMMTNSTHGTPAFTPPECLSLSKKAVGGIKMDIWSLGVTLFALVTGDVPFKGDTMPQLFESIKKDKVEFPANGKNNLSLTVKDLITRLLSKDPADRPSIQEIRGHPWMDGDTHQPRKLLLSVGGSFSDANDD